MVSQILKTCRLKSDVIAWDMPSFKWIFFCSTALEVLLYASCEMDANCMYRSALK